MLPLRLPHDFVQRQFSSKTTPNADARSKIEQNENYKSCRGTCIKDFLNKKTRAQERVELNVRLGKGGEEFDHVFLHKVV